MAPKKTVEQAKIYLQRIATLTIIKTSIWVYVHYRQVNALAAHDHYSQQKAYDLLKQEFVKQEP